MIYTTCIFIHYIYTITCIHWYFDLCNDIQHFILSFLMACTSYFEMAFLIASNEIIFSIFCSTSKTTFGQQLKIFPVQFAMV